MDTLVRIPIVFLLDHLSDADNILTSHVLPLCLPCLHLPLYLLSLLYVIYILFISSRVAPRFYGLLLSTLLLTLLNTMSSLYTRCPPHPHLAIVFFSLSLLVVSLVVSVPKAASHCSPALFGAALSLTYLLMYACSPDISWIFRSLANLVAAVFICGIDFFSPLRRVAHLLSRGVNVELNIYLNPNPLRLYGLITCLLLPLARGGNILSVMSEYSRSYVRLLSLSTVFSYLGRLFALVLNGFDMESEVIDMLETLYGIFVIWTSLLNGIPSFASSQRISILRNNLWLMVLNSLFLLHEIVKSHIRENGGFQNSRDGKPLVTSLIVILGSNAVGAYLLHSHPLDSWLLTMVLLVLENTVSAASLLLLHFLYARAVSQHTLRLDFVLTAVTEAVKYFFSVLLLVTAFYTYLKNGRVFRLINILLHIYVNIYTKARDLYLMIWSRCLIDRLMASFPIASQLQLDARSNMCSICIDDLESHGSCYLPCTHVFHADCIKKWFEVKMRCPVCFAPIILST